jgi:uncharacterized membrane protein (DUF485 family)
MAADRGALIDKIKRDPEFRELVRRRSRFAWLLSALMAVIYFGFILLVAFAPGFLGTPIAEGAITTIGIPLGLFVILSAFVLTGLYVLKANAEFDARTEALLRRLS